MITDDEAEGAWQYLRDNATEDARKRSERLYVEAYLKSAKALIMRRVAEERFGIPVSAQEREALADPEYVKLLRAYQTAVFEDEKARFLREAEQAKLETWRTQQATERAARI